MRILLRNSIALSWGGAMITLGLGFQEESNVLLTVSGGLAILSLALMGTALAYFYVNIWRKK